MRIRPTLNMQYDLVRAACKTVSYKNDGSGSKIKGQGSNLAYVRDTHLYMAVIVLNTFLSIVHNLCPGNTHRLPWHRVKITRFILLSIVYSMITTTSHVLSSSSNTLPPLPSPSTFPPLAQTPPSLTITIHVPSSGSNTLPPLPSPATFLPLAQTPSLPYHHHPRSFLWLKEHLSKSLCVNHFTRLVSSKGLGKVDHCLAQPNVPHLPVGNLLLGTIVQNLLVLLTEEI